jgi:phage gpG-like protein
MRMTGSPRRAVAKIDGIKERVEHPQPLFLYLSKIVGRDVRKNFASHGVFFGRPWQPLKPDYRVWKVAQGYPRSILVMTGELRDTFTSTPGNIISMTEKSVTFGSTDRKAVWHQFGTHRNGKRVNPPRPMLFMNPVLREDIMTATENYIMRGGL